jgi:citrate lyase synthetase
MPTDHKPVILIDDCHEVVSAGDPSASISKLLAIWRAQRAEGERLKLEAETAPALGATKRQGRL